LAIFLLLVGSNIDREVGSKLVELTHRNRRLKEVDVRVVMGWSTRKRSQLRGTVAGHYYGIACVCMVGVGGVDRPMGENNLGPDLKLPSLVR